jgi:hypothetical protein
MRVSQADARVLLRAECEKIGKWPAILNAYSSESSPSQLRQLREEGERLLELIDKIELDIWRAGRDPRRDPNEG